MLSPLRFLHCLIWRVVRPSIAIPLCNTYQSRLPTSDINLTIPGLGPGTNNPDRTLHLNSQQPVTVLVHGCRGSTGNFRALAEVMAFQGQQSACFDYDDRDSLMVSSAQLANSLDQLAAQMRNKQITVIGHSQGALVSRKALVADVPTRCRTPMPASGW